MATIRFFIYSLRVQRQLRLVLIVEFLGTTPQLTTSSRDGYSVKELIHFLTFRFQINSCNFTGRLFMTQLSEHFDVLKWLYKMYLEVYCLGGKGVNEELKCV